MKAKHHLMSRFRLLIIALLLVILLIWYILGKSFNVSISHVLEGEIISDLAIDSLTRNTIYAGSPYYPGIFKNLSGSESWIAADTGLTEHHISALAINPADSTTLYAGTYGGGVFKSIDGGQNWNEANDGLTSLHVQSLAIDPITPSILYIGTDRHQSEKGRMFKSTDGGKRWQVIDTGLASTRGVLFSIVIDPKKSTTLYAGIGVSGVFKSIDGGDHWSATNTGLSKSALFRALVIDPITPNTLYVGTQDGMFKSTDGGNSWKRLNHTIVSAMVINPVTPNTIYAGTARRSLITGDLIGNGVYRSTDGGMSWRRLGNTLNHDYIHTFAIDPKLPTTLYVGTVGGVYVLEAK